MRAAVIRDYGGLDVLHVEDLKSPKPGRGEVALKVLCAGLNHLDIWVRRGRPGKQLKMPHILGSDAAGIVTAVGEGVERPAVGDRVIVNPALSCGDCEFCRRGEQSLCASFGIIGLNGPGTFAEEAVVPANNCYPRPPHLTDEEAGCFALTYLTAWRMLVTRSRLKPGQTVLIHGIGGGVATCALQLAKRIGAEVFVTSSSNGKLSKARELGADHTINYEAANIVEWIKGQTSGRGVDVAVDAVGAATWPLDLACIRKGGTVVLCGVTTGSKAETDLATVYWNQLNVLGSTLGSAEDFRQLVAAASVNQLRPVIDTVFPLDKLRDATARLEQGQQFGKVVLRIAE